ncbi:hypothetical protein DFH27DRAFT_634868 [Peziza echinospora]|nr:hypothetical protein DFH27DRAFT_634868 [Peziza echinospora]
MARPVRLLGGWTGQRQPEAGLWDVANGREWEFAMAVWSGDGGLVLASPRRELRRAEKCREEGFGLGGTWKQAAMDIRAYEGGRARVQGQGRGAGDVQALKRAAHLISYDFCESRRDVLDNLNSKVKLRRGAKPSQHGGNAVELKAGTELWRNPIIPLQIGPTIVRYYKPPTISECFLAESTDIMHLRHGLSPASFHLAQECVAHSDSYSGGQNNKVKELKATTVCLPH